ncbi:MAG: helix-hairpin-helix domain-containing protein [Phycisphaerales bacterium]|nr:helix-hairpin-helix domain-containing protein [Phycisphaerales bacterium]
MRRLLVIATPALMALAIMTTFARQHVPVSDQLAHRLDPATASAAEWTLVPGIGPRTAEELDVARRAGAFEHLATASASDAQRDDALLLVRGIGPQSLRRMTPFMVSHGGAGR